MTDKLYYPEEINERVKNGKGCGSQIGEGWFDIVRELDAGIAAMCPDYVVHQIKEKFGGLRYYIGACSNEYSEDIRTLIDAAAAKAVVTCDVCGKIGELGGEIWVTTRCIQHRN